MCELLVLLESKPVPDNAVSDCQCWQKGDVIVAVPDGHEWSPAERTGHPEWCIVRVPDLSLAEGRALAAAEPEGDRPRRRLFHKRHFRVDVDALGLTGAATHTRDRKAIRAARSMKPPAVDPHVLG